MVKQLKLKQIYLIQLKLIKKKLVHLGVGQEHKFYYGGKVVRNSKNQITVYGSNGDLVTAYTFDMGSSGKKKLKYHL